MKSMQDYITAREAELTAHPAFERFDRDEALATILPFMSVATFWVMGFQDAVRLTAEIIEDPQLKVLAEQHRKEDAGHQVWFLQDLGTIDGAVPDVRTLFGRTHETTRDVTYALISEIYRAEEDIERIVLLLVMEAAFRAALPHALSYVQRMGVDAEFRFIGAEHLEIEANHAIIGDTIQETLEAIVLDEAARTRSIALVDRAFAQFLRLFEFFDAYLNKISETTAERYAEREQIIRTQATAG
ncbi:hypothetical protein GFY24_18105 [Nocardia sp. SYP-A9097]|uniref:hypothetical protein n=1 Tax=Nocardia sp. SYP-A9097 TaxID=2663237 RepID=UPI00129C0CB7|nr:hypothetical protein [Nocardia sp. SYP-A9097]MRH89337.1 hypothetical protein [Nocardia sp. SYP-A9097]